MKTSVPTEGVLAALWLPTDNDGQLLRSDLALVSPRSRAIDTGIVSELRDRFAEWNLAPLGSGI